MPQNVLVTGARGGFGALVTKSLLRDGHNVVGSMRGAQDRNKAIADDESINRASVESTAGIYQAFGMADMLTLRTPS